MPTLRVNQVVKAIEEVRRFMIGKDPFRVEYLFREWYKHEFYISRSFEAATAYSAVDIALHDLLGKYLGAPIYQFLGGLVNEKIKAYANGWYSDCITPDDFAKRAKEVVSMGFKAMKFDHLGRTSIRWMRRALRKLWRGLGLLGRLWVSTWTY